MRNYIVQTTGQYDNETFWTSEDITPEDLMWETIARNGGTRANITIMEVDTLEVVDDEEGYTPGDVFWDFLRDAKDGESASGITRLALWEMTETLVREE